MVMNTRFDGYTCIAPSADKTILMAHVCLHVYSWIVGHLTSLLNHTYSRGSIPQLNARAFIVLGKPVIHTAWATMNGFMPIYGVIAIVQRHQKMHSCLNCLIVDVQAGNCRSDRLKWQFLFSAVEVTV